MNFFLTCLFCICAGSFHAQNFAYSFKGSMTQERQEQLIKNISSIPLVSNCKIKFKSDSNRGDVLIYVTETINRSESDIEFSPVQIKSILIEEGLEPMDFRMLKSN